MSLRVLEPGLYSLIVDYGRPHHRSLGVPLGGAADRVSLALGNALVGNPPDAAALEVTLVGPKLKCQCQVACAVYGADFPLKTNRRRLRTGVTFTLDAGEILEIGAASRLARAYVCVRGGFQQKAVLTSRSAFAPIRAGDLLPCRPACIPARFIRPRATCLHTLRAMDGPQANLVSACEFFGRPFYVAQSSDRMGLRLHGTITSQPAALLTSEPVCPGSIQLLPDRTCIVLGVDGQTIGGYPKVAQVISADLDHLGQFRPGDRIEFTRIDLAEAERLYRLKAQGLAEWLVRLNESAKGWQEASCEG
jgi:antagonist of KipI